MPEITADTTISTSKTTIRFCGVITGIWLLNSKEEEGVAVAKIVVTSPLLWWAEIKHIVLRQAVDKRDELKVDCLKTNRDVNRD